MKIRSAGPEDFEAVTALLEELGREEVTDATRETARATYDAQLADPQADHLVAEDDDGQLAGFCSLHFRARLNHASPQAWIPDLIVTEEYRRAGLGRSLLAEAEKRAAKRGCWSLTLESGYSRAEAHQLYVTYGLTDSGKYFGKLLDD